MTAGDTIQFRLARHRLRREPARALVFRLYWAPLALFGRMVASVGFYPVFFIDLIALTLGLLVLPLALRVTPSDSSLKWFTAICVIFGAINLVSVVRGVVLGYPGPLKGLVLTAYPWICPLVAAWSRVRGADALRHYLRSVQYLAPIGALLATVGAARTVPAATSFYVSLGFALTLSSPERKRGLLLMLSLLAAALLATSGKRGPLLAVFAATLVVLRWSPRTHRRVPALLLGLGIALGLLSLTMDLYPGGARVESIPVFGKVASRLTGRGTGSEAAANIDVRFEIWSFAARESVRHPVLGAGFARPIDVVFRGNDFSEQGTSVHNSFLAVAYYDGFPALALLLCLFARTLYRLSRSARTDDLVRALLGALVAAVVLIQTNVVLEATYIGGPTWVLLGLAFGLTTLPNGQPRSRLATSPSSRIRAGDRGLSSP